MMLIDKGYYDYDYEQPKKKHKGGSEPKTKEELGSMLARFGFNTKLCTSELKSLTPDAMQRIAMAELEEKRANG